MTNLPEQQRDISRVMLHVLLALIPGIAMMAYLLGWGVLSNLFLCSVFCLGFEALALRMRARDIAAGLSDLSALVTAWLLAITLPPLLPWWVLLVGCFFAIIVAKHLYGGLGHNPFNPAMVGYVVLLISYPLPMTQWLIPATVGGELPGLSDSLTAVFGGGVAALPGFDAVTGATPLDTSKTQLGLGLTLTEIRAAPVFGLVSGRGWEWVAALYALGGLYLCWRKIIPWQTPLALFAGMGLLATIFWISDPDRYLSPLFHWLTLGTVIGAFFIATDPVSGCSSMRGRIIFAAGVGMIAWIIRTWGGYPDGIAFGVLLMNMCAPLIDHYLVPRRYGQAR